ncbi:chromosome segregation protein SMC [Angelakisella massiliensis]|uniref:chromosome segregation protein SMC n=1 Tax=Angelakisella massiliensis TaxID=1871018 RepID=UPI0023A88767|nr:chromosome segregation protein SMC [Angelakisella massiliensis]
MKLRAIELQGFKSFADRTKLTFEDGITAVVGPNGSGKSNVSDAVKWVFGEQSSKSLRGAKMEDVIFGGTQNRKPQGYAWVSITIDNRDRTIEVDNDEVIITRKLYRSGESEYLINGSPVRLRDIHEIFMDTGLGRDGYSIIEQGKIAEIVSAKSTQRREIFEEAAGISKFRYRKGEAERRLEQAEENLVRLRDIMGELEGRVAPLKAQSDKAQQFLVLAQEKKSLEISLWLEKMDKLREQLRELEDKLLIAKRDRASAQSRLDEIEAKLEENTSRQQDCTIYMDRKRTEIKELEERLANARTDIAVKENDIVHNDASIQSIRQELESSAATADQMEQQLAAREEELSERRRQLTAEKEGLEQLRETARQQREKIQLFAKRIEALELQRTQMQEEIARARVSSETAATLAQETLARLEVLRSQSQEKDEGLLRLRQEQQENKQFMEELQERIQGLHNTRSGYEYKLSGKKEKIAQLEARQRSLEKAAGEKLQRAQVLTDMERNMEGFSGSVKMVMKAAGSGALRGVEGPLSSLIQVDQQYATAIEIAMGAAMQNIVVADESVAKRAISLLVERKGGRATFLPVSTIRGNQLKEPSLETKEGYIDVAARLVRCKDRYRSIVDWVLGRIIIAEDLDAAIAIGKASGSRYRVVTLDGQVVNAGGSLTGGSVGRSGSILSRKNEIDSLTAEAKEITAQSDEVEQQLAAARKEIASIEALLAGVDGEARTAGEDLIQASAEDKRLSMSISEAEERGKQAAKEFDQLTARMETLKEQGVSSGDLVRQMEQSRDQLTAQLTETQGERDALVRGQEETGEKITTGQVRLAELEKDCQMAQNALDTLRQQKEGSAARKEELTERRQSLEEANAHIREEIASIQAMTGDGQRLIEEKNQEIQRKLTEQQQYEGQATVLRQEERDATVQREAAAGDQGRLEERSRSVSADHDALASKLWDEYELTRSEAADQAIPLEDSAAAQRRLGELRGRIKALGSVNLSAIEEYKEIAQRYEFMKEQIGDVERSKAELTRMITELAAQMTMIFRDKFAAINRNFGQIFEELFGGGKGELKLTDPTDALESGIDIFVQPPGKIIKNLSALSGGEQAFIAICIYFAILKVSPAPFVLIDEIEAALDDVNVGKFAAYLRRMTDRTQFIAITHRRGTMEEADVLYGVTMEEEGVSKLLRLNISELEQKLNLKL